jgi:hypothetical protein
MYDTTKKPFKDAMEGKRGDGKRINALVSAYLEKSKYFTAWCNG